MKLLTVGNPKTEKGEKLGYWTAVLHLAPARLSGHEVCPGATIGCRAACLNTAGRGGLIAGQSRLTYDEVLAGTVTLYEAERLLKERTERALQSESNCLRVRQFGTAKYWREQHDLAAAAQRAVAALLER